MKAKQHKVIIAARQAVSEARVMIEELRDELREALESKSEKWLEGEAGEKASGEADAVDTIADALDAVEADLAELEG